MKKEYRPWKPANYAARHIGLMKNLALGEASPEQQREALHFIVTELCQTYNVSYIPDSDRDTAFAEGRRFVGLQIIKLTKLDVTNLRFDDVGRDGSGEHGNR